MTKENYLKYGQFVVCALLALGILASRGEAQWNPNTITFENQSGEDAVVKLIGPAISNFGRRVPCCFPHC
jgi:hypothetical protein